MKTKSIVQFDFSTCICSVKIFLCFVFLSSFPAFSSGETINFYANSMNGSTSNNNEYTQLLGNAFVKTDSMELKADTIEMTGTDYRYIKASGNVTGTYTEGDFAFTCNSINYDRETEIAVIEGSVSMDDTENDVQIKAEFIEYNKKTEIALIQIGVEIIQDESICTSAFALYRKELQILELSGSPKIIQGDDIFQAQEIIFNLDTEEITLAGKVKGTVTDSNDNDAQEEVSTDASDDDAQKEASTDASDVDAQKEVSTDASDDDVQAEIENAQKDDTAEDDTTDQATAGEQTNE